LIGPCIWYKRTVHHVALFVVDTEQRELVMKAIAGNFVNLFPSNHRILLGQGMVGWAGEHGERLLAGDVQLSHTTSTSILTRSHAL
jgi:putative methionine-R-sulfoxide reductase with GAF domain